MARATASGLMIAKVLSRATKSFLQIQTRVCRQDAGVTNKFEDAALKRRRYTNQSGPLGPSTSLRARSGLYNYLSAAASVLPKSAGVSTVLMPAAAIAAYLSLAVPCPPEMMA